MHMMYFDHIHPLLFFFSPLWQSWGLNTGLARQALYSMSHASSPFGLVILEMGSCFLLRLAYFKFPPTTGMAGTHQLA
jgi:hypothetical protein